MVIALPQHQDRSTDLIGQTLGTNVHLLNVRRRIRCARVITTELHAAEDALQEQRQQCEQDRDQAPHDQPTRAADPLEQTLEPLEPARWLALLAFVLVDPLERVHLALWRDVWIGANSIQSVRYFSLIRRGERDRGHRRRHDGPDTAGPRNNGKPGCTSARMHGATPA